MVLSPEVSIVIPTYNRASFLKRSIGSVLIQTFNDFEVIVVDDASEDNTEEIVNSFYDTRIRYIRHNTNLGGSVARNTGISVARGRYIAFQDSDDEWLIEKLDKQVRVMDACGEEIGAVYAGFLKWDGQKADYSPQPKIKIREGDISHQILEGNFVGTPTLLVRSECLQRIGGFDEALERFQDWDLVIRMAMITRFRLVDEPLVMAYDTVGSITGNKEVSARAREIILNKNYGILKKNPGILARHYCNIGHLNSLYDSTSLGVLWFWRAIKTKPMAARAWVGLVLSLFGKSTYKSVLQVLGRNVVD
jgi:glycosyltransferase involved in cell wall biosynthesis